MPDVHGAVTEITASRKPTPSAGLEPATCDLEDRCSIQLSYEGCL